MEDIAPGIISLFFLQLQFLMELTTPLEKVALPLLQSDLLSMRLLCGLVHSSENIMDYPAYVRYVGCPEAVEVSNTGKVTTLEKPLGSAHHRVLGNPSPLPHTSLPARQLEPVKIGRAHV